MEKQFNEELLQLHIDTVAYGGKGVAKHNQKVYFIQNAIEGDDVLCRITTDKKSFAEGIAVKIVKPSPVRGTSNCTFSDSCGGCQWQGVPYVTQIKWKEKFITDALTRIAQLPIPSDFMVYPSPIENFYRNRVTLRGTIFPDGRIGVGYFRESSKEQIHVSSCNIAHQSINNLIESIQIMSTKSKPQKFRLEVQQLPAGGEKDLIVTLFPIDKPYSGISDFLKFIQKHPKVLWADTMDRVRLSQPYLFEEENSIQYYSSPGQFQQVNTLHNKYLREKVVQAIKRYQPQNIFDLYCGSGNLSLEIAKMGIHVIGVEFNKDSIKMARLNVQENKIYTGKYKQGDALKILNGLTTEKRNIDLLITDPPRAGMKDIIPHILRLNPKRLIYISCDPTTMARDLKLLSTNYILKELKGFDFFPQTYHVESMAILERV